MAFIKQYLSLIILFVFVGSHGFTQDINPKPDSIEIIGTLSIDQISNETEVLRSRINNLREILKPNNRTLEVDSIIDTIRVDITIAKDTLYKEIDNLSRRELKIRQVSWFDFKNKLKTVQESLNDRVQEVSDINEELVSERIRWTSTKTLLEKDTESEDVFSSLDTVIVTLTDLIGFSHIRLDSLFKIEKRITELILIVDESNSEIIRYERQMQKEYFVFDSDPLWNVLKEDTIPIDSTEMDSLTLTQNGRVKNGLVTDYESLKEFINVNSKPFGIQLIVVIFSIILLLIVNLKWGSTNLNINAKSSNQIKIILANPISSSLIIGVLISSFLYDAVAPVFNEIQVLIILSAAAFLLPRMTHKKISLFMGLILVGFFIQGLEPYFEPRSTEVRFMLLLKSIMILIALGYGRKTINENKDRFDRLIQYFKIIMPFYSLIVMLSIIFNFIGMVNLTDILLNGVLTSVALGMILFLAVQIINNLLLFAIEIRRTINEEVVSIIVEAATKRFQPIISLSGLILWLVFTIKGFDFYENILEWAYSLLEIGWRIGPAKISVGNVLSFTIILIVSLFVSKIVASVFQDEWMLKILPRGVAPATSLVMRIVIVSVGVYLSFSAAGFDLTKLGYVFGALSVGIGFGLQNVVLNFIAGVILAFERPINLGDAIEVDNEFGEVTNIGVRSSNIRTFSGAEAIIPNGDLISKKVVNWTLSTRDRRSKILMRTSPIANPDDVIELFNRVASQHPKTFHDPAPKTYFYGYGTDGNLEFALLYWTTFSDTLESNSEIALSIFNELKKEGIEAPVPNQRNFISKS